MKNAKKVYFSYQKFKKFEILAGRFLRTPPTEIRKNSQEYQGPIDASNKPCLINLSRMPQGGVTGSTPVWHCFYGVFLLVRVVLLAINLDKIIHIEPVRAYAYANSILNLVNTVIAIICLIGIAYHHKPSREHIISDRRTVWDEEDDLIQVGSYTINNFPSFQDLKKSTEFNLSIHVALLRLNWNH